MSRWQASAKCARPDRQPGSAEPKAPSGGGLRGWEAQPEILTSLGFSEQEQDSLIEEGIARQYG